MNGANAIPFTHDANGLHTGAGQLSIVRDPQNGRVTASTLGSTTSSWSYNPLCELASSSYTTGSNALFSTSYMRDPVGRIETLTETVQGDTTMRAFAYDSIGRLVQVNRDGTFEAGWEYDANGNRLQQTSKCGC